MPSDESAGDSSDSWIYVHKWLLHSVSPQSPPEETPPEDPFPDQPAEPQALPNDQPSHKLKRAHLAMVDGDVGRTRSRSPKRSRQEEGSETTSRRSGPPASSMEPPSRRGSHQRLRRAASTSTTQSLLPRPPSTSQDDLLHNNMKNYPMTIHKGSGPITAGALAGPAATLCHTLGGIAMRAGSIPKEVGASMRDVYKAHVPDFDYVVAKGGRSESQSISDAAELKSLYSIWREARELQNYEAHEAAWNSGVHALVFNLALEPREEEVWYYNATAMRATGAFLPRTHGSAVRGKLVDFTINIKPKPDSDEQRSIYDLIGDLPKGSNTINQTCAKIVRNRPEIVSVETKSNGSDTTAAMQVHIWAAALFNRLRMLLGPNHEEDCSAFRYRPVITVQKHVWKFMFVVERGDGDSIDLIDTSIDIGSTNTLHEGWRLIANLRHIVDWSLAHYWPILRRRIESAQHTASETST